MSPPDFGQWDNWNDWIAAFPGNYLARQDKPDSYIVSLRRHLSDHPPLGDLDIPQREVVLSLLNRRLGTLARIQYDASKSRLFFSVTAGVLTCASVPFLPLLVPIGLSSLAMGLNEIRAFQESKRIERAVDELSRMIDVLIDHVQRQS